MTDGELDRAIRAFDQGDGATILELHDEIFFALKDYRETRREIVMIQADIEGVMKPFIGKRNTTKTHKQIAKATRKVLKR